MLEVFEGPCRLPAPEDHRVGVDRALEFPGILPGKNREQLAIAGTFDVQKKGRRHEQTQTLALPSAFHERASESSKRARHSTWGVWGKKS